VATIWLSVNIIKVILNLSIWMFRCLGVWMAKSIFLNTTLKKANNKSVRPLLIIIVIVLSELNF
jgi:uncharacterized membrane protein YwzB